LQQGIDNDTSEFQVHVNSVATLPHFDESSEANIEISDSDAGADVSQNMAQESASQIFHGIGVQSTPETDETIMLAPSKAKKSKSVKKRSKK
jgi:hypothetical protein